MPVYRLPREFLGYMFYIYQANTFVKQKPLDDSLFIPLALPLPDVRWLKVTFVFRHFRGISPKEAILWSSIDFSWPTGLVNACFERSSGHHLSLSATGHVEVIDEHSSKIHALQLRDSSYITPLRTLLHPLPNLCWLKYRTAFTFVLDESFLGGAFDLFTTLQISHVIFSTANSFPKFPSLRELVFSSLALEGGTKAWNSLLGCMPALESLTVNIMTITDMNTGNIGDPRYTASQPVSLPALRRFSVIESEMLTVCFCLRNLPEPAHHLIIDICDKGVIDQLYLTYHAEIFARARDFWKKKTGQRDLSPGSFIYTTTIEYVEFVSPDRADGSPAILFRATISISHSFSFWPHVDTLILGGEHSVDILLGDNIHRLSGLRSIIIDIPDPSHGDEDHIREWISRRKHSPGGVSVVHMDFLRDYSDEWKSFFKEIENTAFRVSV